MRIAFLLPVVLCASMWSANAQDEKYKEHTKVGDALPAFSVVDTDGHRFDTTEAKGKLVLVNFWATWCPPCRAEIPRLEKEIWQAFQSRPFAMIAIAREEDKEKIVPFRTKNAFTYPIAGDPKRDVYKLFADAGIPRSIVVDAEGKILFQSSGYDKAEFDRMKKLIDEELKKLEQK